MSNTVIHTDFWGPLSQSGYLIKLLGEVTEDFDGTGSGYAASAYYIACARLHQAIGEYELYSENIAKAHRLLSESKG